MWGGGGPCCEVQRLPMREAQEGEQERRQKGEQINMEKMAEGKPTQTAKKSNRDREAEKKKEARKGKIKTQKNKERQKK